MNKVNALRRLLSPVALVWVLASGACAMYDMEAFLEPEAAEVVAVANTEVPSTPRSPVAPVDGGGEAVPTDPADPADPVVPPAGGVQVVTSAAASIRLAWDPPASAITGYRVYYRVHETGAWMPLGDVAAVAGPEYVVDYPGLGNGDFDFAVTARNGTAESGMHTSLDGTAMPAEGWYLQWRRTE